MRILCLYDGREVTAFGISPWSFCANELPVKDLNYRLNLPDEDVRHLLCSTPTSQEIHALLQFDEVRACSTIAMDVHFEVILLPQLKNSIRHSKAFRGFDEHPITFLPLGVLVCTVAPADRATGRIGLQQTRSPILQVMT